VPNERDEYIMKVTTRLASVVIFMFFVISFCGGCSPLNPEPEVDGSSATGERAKEGDNAILQAEPTNKPSEGTKPGEENWIGSSCTEQQILWIQDLDSGERLMGSKVSADGTVFLLTYTTRVIDNRVYHDYKLHELSSLTGEGTVHDVELGVRLSQGIAYMEDSTMYVIGPHGHVPLHGYDFAAWGRPSNIVMTPAGYLVFGTTMSSPANEYLVSVDHSGKVVWEQHFSREGLYDHRSHSDGPETYDYLFVYEESDTVLVYGPSVRGLHAFSLGSGDQLFTYNISGANQITSVARASDGSYYVTGFTGGPSATDIGMVAWVSPEGIELDSHTTYKFGLVAATPEQKPDTCWFTEGLPTVKARLFKWEMGSEPIEVIDVVGFHASNMVSLLVHDNIVLVTGQGKALLHVVRSDTISNYCLDSLENYEPSSMTNPISRPIIVGVKDNKAIMLMSWQQPLRLLAIDLEQ